MKTVLSALIVALIAPCLIAQSDAAARPGSRTIVVSCPDLSCCPPLNPGDVCVYVGPIMCPDSKGNPKPC